MKKNIFIKTIFTTLIALFSVFLCFTQENIEQKPIKSGVITLTSGTKKEFVNLRYQRNMVIYTNIETDLEENLLLTFIKNIEEKEVDYTIKEESKENNNFFKPNYPEGIYLTKEAFINKKPSQVKLVIPKNIYGKKKPLLSIVHNCFFYDGATDKKMKNVFAISYKGHLYFQIHAILKNRNRTDRAQTSSFHNSFVRVLMGGENYLYTEADLANQWAQAALYNVASGVLADDVIYGKGIVWDFKNQEFNIFKNCRDYNIFVEEVYPEGKQKCEEQQPDVLQIREAVEKFK